MGVTGARTDDLNLNSIRAVFGCVVKPKSGQFLGITPLSQSQTVVKPKPTYLPD